MKRKEVFQAMRSFHITALVILAALVSLAMVIPAVSASAATFKWKGGKLQPLPDGFPSRPIHVVVMTGAGANTDIYSRTVAKIAERMTTVPWPVINRKEPNSTWGTYSFIKKQRGGDEGYFVNGNSTSWLTVALRRDVGYSLNDYKVLWCHSGVAFILVVRADSPMKTLKDLIDYARANPGKVRIASSRAGSNSHSLVLGLADNAKIDIVDLPHKGGAKQGMLTMLGGGAEAAVPVAADAVDYLARGEVRGLALGGKTRADIWSDLPTFSELGYDKIPTDFFTDSFSIPHWVSPKYPERVEWLREVLKKVGDDPEYREYCKRTTRVLLNWGPEEFNKWTKATNDGVDRIFRAMGIHKDQQKKK